MLGRVAVLGLLLSVSLPLFPQCSWTPRYSGQFRAGALDLSISSEGFLWVATGYGVQLFDVSEPLKPRLTASAGLPGITRVIHAGQEGIAYAGSGSRLYVLRREGTKLSVIRSIETGGTVQDIASATYLFVATAAGIAHFDLIDPSDPFRTNVSLPTSSPSVSSLAITSGLLYATDGDSTVERFSISPPSFPQHTGTLESLARSTAVHAAPGGLLLVSDQFGQNTDVFSGTTRIARLALGANSFASGAGDLRFLAGPDRTLRAASFSSLDEVVELFEAPLSPGAGTDNVIHSMLVSNTTLYVAAGDIGLAVLDAGLLAVPYPQAGYGGGATTSVVASAGTAWFTDASGMILEQRVESSGLSLVAQRNWAGGDGARVHDVSGTTLLSASGATATLWSLAPATPAIATNVTFPAAISSAIIRGAEIVALLADGSVWSGSSTPQPTALAKMMSMGRSGAAIAFAEERTDGTTVLHYYASGDLTAPPSKTTVAGSPIGGIALSPGRAALFTFNGMNIIDLPGLTVRVIDGSNAFIPLQFSFSGNDLLVLSGRELIVYEGAISMTRAHSLTAAPVALAAAAPYALIATSEGRLADAYLETLPEAGVTTSGSHYRGAAAAQGRLDLSGAGRIDLHSTAYGHAPHFTGSIGSAGIIDFATTANALYTLSASGRLTAWSRTGAIIAQRDFDEGSDAQALSIDAVAGTLWLAFSKGCLSGGCRKETIVVDAQSLAATATMTGGVVEAVVSGDDAWALFDLPDEVRALDVEDPLQPVQIASATAPATARSIAHMTGRAVVLGDRVYSFNDRTLAAAGTFLPAVAATSTHRMVIDGNCAVITGRNFHPELYDVRNWSALPLPSELPSSIRTLVRQPGRLIFLTDHSIEIWGSTPVEPSPRRRGVR